MFFILYCRGKNGMAFVKMNWYEFFFWCCSCWIRYILHPPLFYIYIIIYRRHIPFCHFSFVVLIEKWTDHSVICFIALIHSTFFTIFYARLGRNFFFFCGYAYTAIHICVFFIWVSYFFKLIQEKIKTANNSYASHD